MAKAHRKVTLVFDGDCGACTRSVRVIKTFDRERRIATVPYQMPGVPASAGLTVEACKAAAWAVTPEGLCYRGAGAVNLALRGHSARNSLCVLPFAPDKARTRPRLRLDRREPSQTSR